MEKAKGYLILCIFLLPFLLLSQSWRICTRVIDGDTIVLDGEETVRLIGVDTPETKDPRKPVQYFGQEAYEFTRSLVEGKRVRLEYDQERNDKYGRTLAYVYLEDGTFLNTEIIKQGYGFAYTQFPFKYLEEFRQYEREARENERGLWAPKEEKKPEISGDTIVYITATGKKYHSADCRYLSKSKIPIALKEAVQRGFTACSVCNPPLLKFLEKEIEKPKAADDSSNIIVYITKTGSKYHQGNCSYLSKSKIPISLKDAVARGYMPCSRCNPPTVKSSSNKSPEKTSTTVTSSTSSSGKTIYTGPRGGKYYINSKGKKVYVKKKK
jgi:micrococcal nuclease